MFSFKRFFILFFAVVIVTVSVSAQQTQTVQESYLRESIEVMIIRETARTNNRASKEIALDYIGEALNRGNTNDEIRQTLEYLSSEGTRNAMRESGRNINNFPEIRRSAAKYLGQVGTEQARKNLVDILIFENEPMVIQEAIKSLGDIGSNENDETVTQIIWAFNSIHRTNPDNLVAISTIDAIDKITRKSGRLSNNAMQALLSIADQNSSYNTVVRERARQVLANMRSYGR
ncbi:MAG: HEAT repeat domain-containing protein [Treponema sp.]|nr:HEAT repeat domain-containing protein [Treponema sp.]